MTKRENFVRIKINKTIEYGLYLLVFLLPWQTRWIIKAGELNGGYWEYGSISLYMTDILLLALLVLFAISFYKKRAEGLKFKFESYWWMIAGLELFVFISIFFAVDKILAIYKYGIFLLGVGLFWLITNANYNKIKLILSLLAGIFIQACLGIWQFLTQSSFSSKWLGIAMHKAGELGTSVIEIVGADGVGERWLRAYGALDHPNVLGGILAVGLFLFIYQNIINSKSKIIPPQRDPARAVANSKQAPNPKSQIPKFILNYFLLIIFVSGLFFSFSRAAWLGLIVGLIIVFILLFWKRDLRGQKKFLEFALIGGVIVFLLFNFYSDLATTRLKGDSRLETKSSNERMELYNTSKEIISNNWIFGIGIGNYTLVEHYKEGGNKCKFADCKILFNNYYQPVHNVFLLVWAEIGIFGMLFFISLLFYACYSLFKGFKKNKNFNVYQVGLLVAMIVMFLVDHWFWSLHFGVLIFWMVMGLMLREKDV